MASPRDLIVIVGVTGRQVSISYYNETKNFDTKQGSSVAETFLSLGHWKVRGITRDPGSAAAKAQAAKGVELVKGDLDDTESLKSAFAGATAVFLATDFWTIFKQPEMIERAQTTGTFLPKLCHDQEIQQGLNAVSAASSPDVLCTLKRFVFSTLTPITNLSGGKHMHAYHFDSKARIEEHIRNSVPEVAKLLSTVLMGVFAENWKEPNFAPQKQPDGTWAFNDPELPGTFDTMPFVVASRDTGKFVKALVVDQQPGTRLYGVSEFKTYGEVAKIWEKVHGAPTVARSMQKDEFAHIWPEMVRDEVVECFEFAREFEYAGNDSELRRPWDLEIETTTLEEYLRSEDWPSLE